jgi:hypothetical protein
MTRLNSINGYKSLPDALEVSGIYTDEEQSILLTLAVRYNKLEQEDITRHVLYQIFRQQVDKVKGDVGLPYFGEYEIFSKEKKKDNNCLQNIL